MKEKVEEVKFNLMALFNRFILVNQAIACRTGGCFLSTCTEDETRDQIANFVIEKERQEQLQIIIQTNPNGE